MTKIAIVGATGYTALELIKILLRHPHAEIEVLTTREPGNPPISKIHPSLTRLLDRACEPFDVEATARRVECAFCALPHGASMEAVAPLVDKGVRVIDLSADYRLRDPNVYAEWYGESHRDLGHLSEAVYGLPELYGDAIPSARLVANPGCYPTSAILGLAPLLAGELIEPAGIIIDSKSGVSGAGRNPSATAHFPECNEGVKPYNIGKHRHTPEIAQVLSDTAGKPVQVVFTPHLIPMDRGIVSTIYGRLRRSIDESHLLAHYREFYAGKKFVRVVDQIPGSKDSVGTNFCDMTVRVVGGFALVVSCLDNLIKGASGAAVQNFNLMFGYPEGTALLPSA